MSNPLVSVMMAAYNAEAFIGQAIESIIGQTYQNWELLVLDDGSTDKTRSIAEGFRDPRIRVFKNERNMGLVYTRNRLAELSNGKYLAVLDSDDISYPERLSKQVQFLDKHPDYGLVGSSIEMIDSHGSLTGETWSTRSDDKAMATRLFFHNHIAHSTVMMRRTVLPNPVYREGFAPSEDYDLWTRLCQKTKIHNFTTPLVAYRLHGSNTSFGNIQKLAAVEKKILAANLTALMQQPATNETVELAHNLFFGKYKELENVDPKSIQQLLTSLWENYPGQWMRLNKHIYADYLLSYLFNFLKIRGVRRPEILRQLWLTPVGGTIYKLSFIARLVLRYLFDTAKAPYLR